MSKKRGYLDLAYAAAGFTALLVLAFGRGWSKSDRQDARGRIPLHLAYFPNLTHAPALVGIEKGFFQAHLKKYFITSKVVNAGPEAMEALLAGDVDVAYVGPSPATNTFVRSHGTALRIIAGACSGGASLVCRAELDIHSVRDLDGHSVAVPQLGGTQDVSCRHFLDVNGLVPKDLGGTVTIVPLKNPDILTLFRRGQIDSAWVPEPWASRLVSEANAKRVVDERDLWPNRKFTTTVVVAREAFLEAHPDAVRQFIDANEETIAWMGAHADEARETANEVLKRLIGKGLKKDVLAQAWSNLDFTTDPNRTSIVAFADAAFQAGYLTVRPANVDGLVVPSDFLAVRPKESVAKR